MSKQIKANQNIVKFDKRSTTAQRSSGGDAGGALLVRRDVINWQTSGVR